MKNSLISTILLLLSPFTEVFGVDFYVSTSGNNSDPGTQALPWRTIQHAAENATAGSTVYIMAGTYQEQVWMEANNGSAGNYITFTHFANDVVVLDGGSTNSQTVLFTLSGVQYVRIDGLQFRNAMGNFSSAITVRDGAQHIELLNNTIENIHFSTNPNAPVNSSTNANPLIVYGDNAVTSIIDVKIQNNTVRNCRTGFSEALTVNGNVDGFMVLNNTVHDITNIGIDLAGGYGTSSNPANDAARNGLVAFNTVYNCVSSYAVSAGIYADGSRDIVIEQNTVHGCGRGFELGCEEPGKTASNIIIRNNLAYQNLEAGIGIGGYNYPNTGKVVNCKLLNNTFYHNVVTNNGDGELLIEYTENCSVKQNMFIANNADKRLIVSRLNSTGLALDYNLYHHPQGTTNISIDWEGSIYTNFTTYQSVTGQDSNSPFGDPLFTAPGSLDFHIGTNSPAYNAGDPAFVPASGETDMDGDSRLEFGRVDIGSDEVAMALPVDYLAELTAEIVRERVVLHWASVQELNASHYEVLKSRDGSHFEQIGKMAAAGKSSSAHFYHFADSMPWKGLSYYCLRQVDVDGTTNYSKTVTVEFNPLEYELFPNPSTEYVIVQSGRPWDFVVLRNSLGQPIERYKFGREIDLSAIPSGIYYLEVFEESGSVSKLLKGLKW